MKKTLVRFVAGFGLVGLLSLMALPAFAAEADTEPPSDVENFQGTALNGGVDLTWDAATDNVGVTGYQVHYGTSPVTDSGQTYDNVEDVGDVTEYNLSGLENGTQYYFSVIAYDAAGEESQAWAQEISLTPSVDAEAGVDDTEAPQVSDAEALNQEEVKVVFSEPIKLPVENPEVSFTIENDDTFELLDVLAAKMDEDDETGKTVILTTNPQEAEANYQLTVQIDIEDMAGNPIISGTSDTAAFVGSGDEKAAEDVEGPEVTAVEVVDNTHILLTFNETIVLSIDPAENFSIMEEDDPTKTLQVLGVELGVSSDNVEDAAAIITTSPQEEKNYVVVVTGVTDEAGNEINPTSGSGTFTGVAVGGNTDGDDGNDGDDGDDGDGGDGGDGGDTNDGNTDNEDLIPPKDVANFLAEKVLDGAEYMVKLTWDIPEENIGDVIEQIIYMSKDQGENYGKEATVDPEITEHEVKNLAPGEYWFKITQVDVAGNESEGVIKKITLTETGPGVVGLVLVSLGLGRVVGRRKNK